MIGNFAIYITVAISLIALLYAGLLIKTVFAYEAGKGKVGEISRIIKAGANSYLKQQFKAIKLVIILIFLLLFLSSLATHQLLFIALGRATAFLVGSFFSGAIGYIGMNMAINGSHRVVQAAFTQPDKALTIAYRSGAITGMLINGLGLLGGTIIFIVFGYKAPEVLLGFGLGGTLIALFMRVGGGIFTKAADVGADTVGKLENKLPEDDSRNAAVIADLVGDNVGDCAGMAADIFESYEVTMVSAMILALSISPLNIKWLVFPLLVRAAGIVSSIIGIYTVGWWKTKDPYRSMDKSYDLSAFFSVIAFFLIAELYMNDLRVFLASTIGILLAIGYNKFTRYFTHRESKQVSNLTDSAKGGTAPLILSGLSLGFESSTWAIFITALAVFLSSLIFTGSGVTFVLYGVALCGIGMLSQTGNNMSMDVFGPVADNANGIAQMARPNHKAQKTLAILDACGNTTKAITKGLAIASAVIASIALFGSFINVSGLQMVGLSLTDPMVFIGLLIGGGLPFLFSSISIKAVGRTATVIIHEVRKQFKIPGVLSGKIKPNYNRVIQICTVSAQKELLTIGSLAILTPLVIGFILKERALGGCLAGTILVGQLLAVFMANSGGAWDNAKKKIESGYLGGKGSAAYLSAVVGDTIGDPLKDTAGPALNPIIKVINMIALLIAPLIIMTKNNLFTYLFFYYLLIAVVIYFIWTFSKRLRFQ